jgi:hypothetical protein
MKTTIIASTIQLLVLSLLQQLLTNSRGGSLPSVDVFVYRAGSPVVRKVVKRMGKERNHYIPCRYRAVTL